MITALSPYSINGKSNNINPSFTSIHKANYFVRMSDGHYEKASDELAKRFQRMITGMLNKDINDINQPKRYVLTPYVEDAATILRKAVVTLFKKCDTLDYLVVKKYNGEILDIENSVGMVRSFSASTKTKNSEAYIITGSDMNVLKNALSASNKDYSVKVLNSIRNVLSQKNPKHTEFNAYFVPMKKGKELTYELVNAQFVRPQ